MESNDFLFFVNDNGITDKDTISSEKYIKEFHSIVNNSNYSVYALSSDWGSGKTCFIKMWENILKFEEKQYIHIDAFKADYESDPFIMLLKAFKNTLRNSKSVDKTKFNTWLDKAKKLLSLRNILRFGFNIAVDKTIGLEPMKELLNAASDTTFDLITDENSLYDELQSTLNELLNEHETLYIIIDELDRCRPDFALETLERIKHIFNIKNVKYILIFNEEIMKSIINKKYGDEINAYKYLQKFVQKTYVLDNKKRQLRYWYITEVSKYISGDERTHLSVTVTNCIAPLIKIADNFGLNLRDIQYLIFNISHYNLSNDQLIVTLFCYELLKIIDKDKANKMYFEYIEYKKNILDSPSRDTFYKLLKYFEEFKNKENDYFDELFFNLMEYFEW